MTLQELLRVHTREAEDSLKHYEEKIRDLGNQRRAELVQIDALQNEIDEKNANEDQKHHQVEDCRAKIRELENQIEQLQRKGDRLREELQTLTATLKSAEEDVKGVLEQNKKRKTRAEALEHEIKEFVLEKERSIKRFRLGGRAALCAYLESLETKLTQHIELQKDISEKIASRKRLEQARHVDTEMMNLYEARTELQKLLKVSNISSVRDNLSKQLRGIESQIEDQFPGALAIENHSGPDTQIEEIFFWSEAEKTQFFLPISPKTL